MKRTALALAAICILAVGTASANPIPAEQLYVSFDPPNRTHSTYPAPGAMVSAYVVLDFEMGILDGFSEISFRLWATPGMGSNYVFHSYVPGTVVGNWETGITIVPEECVTTRTMTLGKLRFIYEGIPGDITIEDHPDHPRLILDCEEPAGSWIYCVWYHGGVGKPAIQGDCAVSPVEDVSWTAIKGLYGSE